MPWAIRTAKLGMIRCIFAENGPLEGGIESSFSGTGWGAKGDFRWIFGPNPCIFEGGPPPFSESTCPQVWAQKVKIRSPGCANIVVIVEMVATRSLRFVWLVTKGGNYRNRKYQILPTNTYAYKSRVTLFHMTFGSIKTAIQSHVFWFSAGS